MQPNAHQTTAAKPSLARQVCRALIGSMQSYQDMQARVEHRYH